jgi:penicillin-binding protein 2
MKNLKKKIIYLYICFIFVFFVIILNLYEIQTNDYYKMMAENQQTKEVMIAKSRGMIYDCNMIPLVNYSQKSDYIFYDKTFTFTSIKRYDDENLASQLIGYIDNDFNGISGIEKTFDDILKKYSGKTLLKYKTTARDDVLLNRKIEMTEENYLSKGGVKLTIDKTLQRICDNALEQKTNGGAVVIIDIKSGALRAVSSYPKVNQNNPSKNMKNDRSPFVNRAFSSYNVGSIFKLVTASCALEEGITLNNYYCKGYSKVGNKKFSCYKKSAHKDLDMQKALEKSCNCYFIELSKKLPKEKLLYYAKRLGFGTKSYFANGLYSKSGMLPTLEDLSSKEEMSALSFGQSKLTATPLQITELTATIANDGIRQKPYLIEGLVNSNGRLYRENTRKNKVRAITEKTADILKDYMINVSVNGTGKSGFPIGITGGSKTATAQTGIIKNNREILQTWYTGFVNDKADNPKYAITVLVEDGISGSKSAAPVYYKILSQMKSMGYI